jgi:hypothetical protein
MNYPVASYEVSRTNARNAASCEELTLPRLNYSLDLFYKVLYVTPAPVDYAGFMLI